MSEIKYRELAESALARAKILMKSGDTFQFSYAALELRQALEALTYEVALMMKEELPVSEYAHWQPRKLINSLKEIDPNLFVGMTISVEMPKDKDCPNGEKEWKVLGQNNALTLDDVKKHYDALGFYLHVPTIGQIIGDKLPQIESLKKRCEKVIEVLDKVFESTLFNINANSISTLPECTNPTCKKPVRVRMPFGEHTRPVTCLECKAEYKVSTKGDGFQWEAKTLNVRCPDKECGEVRVLWKHELLRGQNWICTKCEGKTSIEFCVLCERTDGNGIFGNPLKVPDRLE